MMRSHFLWLWLMLYASLVCGQGVGQDTLKRLQTHQEQTQPLIQPQPVDAPLIPKPTSPMASQWLGTEQPCFVIERIDWQIETFREGSSHADGWGNSVIPSLNKWVSETKEGIQDTPLGRCLGAVGVGQLIARAQDGLIEQGWVTSRVLAPPQDLNRGVLKLSLLAGMIEQIKAVDVEHPHPLNAIPLRVGEVLNLRSMEQGLDNLKRVPTAKADIQIKPGTSPSTSELIVEWKQTKKWRLNGSVDDSGSQSTGKWLTSLTGSWDNPFGLADMFYVSRTSGLRSPEGSGTRGLSLHYSIPFGSWLMGYQASENRYHQSVAGLSQTYVYSGQSSQKDIKITYLLGRNAQSKTHLNYKLFLREASNFIDDTEIEVQRRRVAGWELGIGYKFQQGSKQIEGQISYKKGTGALGSLPAPEEAFGEGTSQFGLIQWEVSSQLPFKWGSHDWQYNMQLKGQQHKTPLTPQDRWSIGGRYTVRGFDGEQSLSSESGWIFRNEWLKKLGESSHKAYVAVDYGQVSGPSSEWLLGQRLSGMAVGVKGQWEGLSGQWQYDIFVGRPIQAPEGFRTAKQTAGMMLSASF